MSEKSVTQPLRIALLSPYHGGSHKSWADGLQAHSKHDIRLYSLPARFWKWRMHGAAVTLARRVLESGFEPEVILATDMLDLSTFLSLVSRRLSSPISILYLHENQLTYPLPRSPMEGPMRRQKGERDLHYAFINYASMLAADLLLFNSYFHLEELFSQLPKYLRRFPEYQGLEEISGLRRKSDVLPVGINLQRFDYSESQVPKSQPPLILWNQRWEYDKNPELLFATLKRLKKSRTPFRLAICGQNYRRRPAEFDEARDELSDHIEQWGFAEEPRYREVLSDAAVVISTSIHEFFGISVIEAIYSQAFPILPKRLSYREIIPVEYHDSCLYEDSEGLYKRLVHALSNESKRLDTAARLARHVSRYDWSLMGGTYDTIIDSAVSHTRADPMA